VGGSIPLAQGIPSRFGRADTGHMQRRGLELLWAHLRCLDPDAPTARQRLDDAVGPALAAFLIAALAFRLAA
jgi:hypothetical protein